MKYIQIYQQELMSHKNLRLRNMTFNETFQSSLIQRNNDKFVLDKSLVKGIKQNDPSKIIDGNRLSEAEDKKEAYDQVGQIQMIIMDTRKRYDEVKTTSAKCQIDIQKLKNQKEQLVVDQLKYKELIDKQRRDLDQTVRRLESVTHLMQDTVYRKQIYTNIKDVVKHDLLVLKKRFFDKDVTLMRENTKLKTIKSEHESKIKLSQRCKQVLLSVEKTAHLRQVERNEKIKSVYQILNKKQATVQSREARGKEIEQAMMSAMTDKLSQEKQWIKMFLSSLLAKGVLKSKMQRLMKQYQVIQLTFHRMKQATSIKDSNQFIQRYLGREETYGLLLESIGEKEKQLEVLKTQNGELEKANEELTFKGEEIMQKKSKPTKSNKKQQKVLNVENVLDSLNETLISITKKKQLLYNWGTKFLTAYNNYPNRNVVLKKFPKQSIKGLMLEVLKTINTFITDLQKSSDHNNKIEEQLMKNNPKERFMVGDMAEKNVRIKTLSTFENQGHDNFDDKDVAYDDLSEADYIQYNRRAIKKNDLQNRKFRIKTKPF